MVGLTLTEAESVPLHHRKVYRRLAEVGHRSV